MQGRDLRAELERRKRQREAERILSLRTTHADASDNGLIWDRSRLGPPGSVGPVARLSSRDPVREPVGIMGVDGRLADRPHLRAVDPAPDVGVEAEAGGRQHHGAIVGSVPVGFPAVHT